MKKIISFAAFGALLASCNSNSEAVSQQRVIDSLKTEAATRHIVDSVSQAAQLQQQQAPIPVTNETPAMCAGGYAPANHHVHHSGSTTNNTTNNTYTTAANAPATTEPTPAKKKGWSAKAKGAVIGAGVGAITGAMVDKKKGQGAVIGGILGAGAGTGVGAIVDKKQGR